MSEQILVSKERSDESYALGYRHGSDSDLPDSRTVADRPAYFRGYAAGSEARDRRLLRGEGHVIIPTWMTPPQVEAINTLYRRSPDGSPDRYHFFTRVQECGIAGDYYAGIGWCNQFIGIEVDGYAHS